MGLLLQTALAEAAGGAMAGIVADSVLYALDSAKVRSQAAATITSSSASSASSASSSSSSAIIKTLTMTSPQQRFVPNRIIIPSNIRILFRGMVPTILLGSVPVFSSFFFIYAPIRDILIQEYNFRQGLPLVSAICAVPATIIGVPSDVLKKRLVLGIDPTLKAAIQHVVSQHGGSYKGLFVGWHVNLLRDLPFAGIKIGLYEWLVQEWHTWFQIPHEQPISPLGAATCGITSGIGCAILTCPLDVVNTRIKSDMTPIATTSTTSSPMGSVNNNKSTTSTTTTSIVKVATNIIQKEGIRALFRGVALRSVVLGIGGSIFWPIQRMVSHSLQPYEKCPFKDILMEF